MNDVYGEVNVCKEPKQSLCTLQWRLQCESWTSICVFKWSLQLLSLWLLQVPECPAVHRPRPRSASQWPGVDHVHKDDAARAAEREDLGGLLPPRAAVCLLPSTHHPLHLCQHPHLLVGVLSGFCVCVFMFKIQVKLWLCIVWSIFESIDSGVGHQLSTGGF